MGVALSYTATLKIVDQISDNHTAPLQTWLAAKVPIKFVGDNVQKSKGVRDVRSDHQKSMLHMYSMLVVRGRVSDPSLASTGCTLDLSTMKPDAFLPTEDEISDLRMNLCVLISRVFCKYIKCLKPLSKVICDHIPHQYHSEMAQKSETYFLDVLMKNEAKHSDMVDIMITLHNYLGKTFKGKVISGGDQLTCERQFCAQRHLMDGDNPYDCLQNVEPVSEDWHSLMNLLMVSLFFCGP